MSLFIKTENITDVEELIESLKINCTTAKKLRGQIEKLNIYGNENILIQNIRDEIKSIKEVQEKENEIEDDEYLYYYEDIKNIKQNTPFNEMKEIIKNNLPSKENCNYINIINRIKFEIFKEIKEIEKFLDTPEKNLLNEAKQLIEFYKLKLNIIDEIMNEKESTINIEEEHKENTILFLETKSGNIYAIDDINSIDHEYYESFKELYESIKNGTFKNVKRFCNDVRINSFSEVKDFKTRIIFDRLSSNTYIILMVLVKKCDVDYAYKNSLTNRTLYYKSVKQSIIEKMNKPEYLLSNLSTQENFENILKGNRVK